MVFLNQILFKYYENLGICYILYYLDIHQKELKSVEPVLLNPGALLLFVARSTTSWVTSHMILPVCCWPAVTHQYIKWWPHLLWVNICSIGLLKFQMNKINDFWSSSEGNGCIMMNWVFVLSVSFKRPSFTLMIWRFWRMHWGNFQMEIEANKNLFSWIELTKNKNSLVRVAFNWDHSFVSFGLFGKFWDMPLLATQDVCTCPNEWCCISVWKSGLVRFFDARGL